MKYFFKRYWIPILIAFIISFPLFILGVIRTNKTVTLKGDTTIVENFVEIDNAYSQKGSFSTIYVISFDHSTILQNLMLDAGKTSEVADLPENYLHFTDSELSQMGRIQHEASIMYALINAYRKASLTTNSISIDYSFDAYVIYYYDIASEFRIGDRIIGVNGLYAKDDFNAFREAFNNRQENDLLNVERGSSELAIQATSDNMRVAGYSFYNIDSAAPSYKIKPSNVGGPSGGLLQTLALYNALIEEDITKGYKIAGTGTIAADGTVGAIGGIQQKIYTAFDDAMDIFLCPEANYEEALIAYNKLKNKEKMQLYAVSTLDEALEVLANA